MEHRQKVQVILCRQALDPNIARKIRSGTNCHSQLANFVADAYIDECDHLSSKLMEDVSASREGYKKLLFAVQYCSWRICAKRLPLSELRSQKTNIFIIEQIL